MSQKRNPGLITPCRGNHVPIIHINAPACLCTFTAGSWEPSCLDIYPFATAGNKIINRKFISCICLKAVFALQTLPMKTVPNFLIWCLVPQPLLCRATVLTGHSEVWFKYALKICRPECKVWITRTWGQIGKMLLILKNLPESRMTTRNTNQNGGLPRQWAFQSCCSFKTFIF